MGKYKKIKIVKIYNIYYVIIYNKNQNKNKATLL